MMKVNSQTAAMGKKERMKIITTILLILSIQICYSQEKPIIRELIIYSLKDTIGIDFTNADEMEKWKWYKRSYDLSGNLIEEINYPFPHDPTDVTTKIKRIERSGDTTITTILDGEQKTASQTICYKKSKFRKCVTYYYASLTSSCFKNLDPYSITTTIKDSIKNEKTFIRVSTDGIVYDTIKNITQPLIYKGEYDNNQQIDFIIIDTIKHEGFCSYGYMLANKNDTLCLSATIEYEFDMNNKIRENIYCDLERNFKTKTITTYQNNLVMEKTQYYSTSEGWQISNKITKEYNQNNDIKLKIRDDYSNGKFKYRQARYFEYKYYE